MIIRQVTICNFFCYLGENKFAFDEGLNIVSGRNGSGKSQFFNAFYWTFFDKIYTEDNAEKKKKWTDSRNVAIYPHALIPVTDPGGQFTTSVSVSFNADDYNKPAYSAEEPVTYIFKREVTFRNTDRGFSAIIPAELSIEYIKDGETFILSRGEHDMVLDKIFPKSIRKFMWYQGETMDELYNFSKVPTLNAAINEISYFPKYDFMNKVVIAADKSINKKIEKELAQQNRLTREQNAIYNDISFLEKTIDLKEGQKNELAEQLFNLEDEMTRTEQKLEGMDQFVEYKVKLAQLEAELRNVKDKIDDIDINTKERLINTWMLNRCDKLIKASGPNLEMLNAEIQQQQAHKNPVPMNLPGPEYVEQMLNDKVCYICERPVEPESDAYEALKRRLNDFELNAQVKLLQENYTELNRYRKKLLTDLPKINEEIAENQTKQDNLIKRRNALGKQINNLFADLGMEGRADLDTRATAAQQNVQKLKTYRADITAKQKRLSALEQELMSQKASLFEKKRVRDGFTKADQSNLVESQAADYITLFLKSISVLKDRAYDTLIAELEQESNRLYALYLDNKQQGRITIGNGVHVVDVKTDLPLIDLNQGEVVAQKLAVANAFLSLSERKMNRSYPLIADAPSSDLDAVNTYNLTVNIGGSFEQIIIMSKDYIQFSDHDLNKLIVEANVKHFYRIDNQYIDPNGGTSRQNRRSIATIIK